jgi:hypothetical protein
MFDGGDDFSVRPFILMHHSMPHKLLGGVRMLGFGQPRKFTCAHGSGQAELFG